MKIKVCSNLSKELRKSLKKRSLPLRKGDKVKVMRGSFAGKEAKVISVDRKKGRAFLENITKKKADGTEKNIGIHASNLQIVEIESKDEKRVKGKAVKAKEKKADKEKEENKK